MAREPIRFGIGTLLAVIAGTTAVCFVVMRPGERSDAQTPRQNARSSPPKPVIAAPDSPAPALRRPTPKKEENPPGGMALSNIPSSLRKTTIGNSGTLPSDLARELGFDEEQTKLAQAEITRFRSKMEDSVSARAYRDEQASKPDIGVDVYRIPALPDGGEALRAEFEANLARIGGAPAAARLIEGLGPKSFGGYGRYDVVVKFSPDEQRAQSGNPIQADYVFTDPKNGMRVLSGNCILSSFSEQFGGWTAVAPDHQ